jgi:hypothetical protein
MTDLELAARAGDPRTAELAGDVVALLADVPGGGPAAADYRAVMMAVPGAPADRLATLLERARTGVTTMFDREYLDTGAWLEAARVAASARDSAFFDNRVTREALERIGNLRPVPPPVRGTIDSVRRRAGNNRARDWDTLTRMLRDALSILAS